MTMEFILAILFYYFCYFMIISGFPSPTLSPAGLHLQLCDKPLHNKEYYPAKLIKYSNDNVIQFPNKMSDVSSSALQTHELVEDNINELHDYTTSSSSNQSPSHASVIQHNIMKQNLVIPSDDHKTNEILSKMAELSTKFDFLENYKNAIEKDNSQENLEYDNQVLESSPIADINVTPETKRRLAALFNNQNLGDQQTSQEQPSYNQPKQIDQNNLTELLKKCKNGEIFIHRPAPIIVKRPPTKILVNHPPLYIKPSPVIFHRPPSIIIRPVIVKNEPQPVKVQPIYVKVIKSPERKIFIDPEKFNSSIYSNNYINYNQRQRLNLNNHNHSQHYGKQPKDEIKGYKYMK